MYVCMNSLYFYVLGLSVMSLLYVLDIRRYISQVASMMDCVLSGSIFTVLLCHVCFFRANKLSLSLPDPLVGLSGTLLLRGRGGRWRNLCRHQQARRDAATCRLTVTNSRLGLPLSATVGGACCSAMTPRSWCVTLSRPACSATSDRAPMST